MIESFIFIWKKYLIHVVDISLVGFLIYKFLILIKGTRAVQIAVGLIVLAGLTALSQFVGLPSLNWLLEKFWIAGFVILAVVFQPELRSALAQLGTKTSSRFSMQQELTVVNEIVAAVKEASRRQMGMLIAIERNTGLRDYLETGTLLNAEITRELLLTIFQPPAALHDGGVIVQSNRIVAAGCIFPVSQDASLSKWLGTRHRAAVGISEVSDCWSICVSEETGAVSLAIDGKLKTQMDPDELREELIHLLRSKETV
ncbi:MAG: diadenylate cyclase CdaA [Elusimicrobiota bacterium]